MKGKIGGANNVGIDLTREQTTKLSDRFFGKYKQFVENDKGTANGQMFIHCQSLGVSMMTVYNILRDKRASKKVLEKIDFIINK